MKKDTPGTYALVLSSTYASILRVGRLGEMRVQPGTYVYVGSAFGPGGLRGRLSHHFSEVASPHWHIDYLRPAAELVEVWVTEDVQKREHEWAQALASSREASIPLPGFGASDCRCPAHLFFFPFRPTVDWFLETLGKIIYTIYGKECGLR